jgi:hypothetical protein
LYNDIIYNKIGYNFNTHVHVCTLYQPLWLYNIKWRKITAAYIFTHLTAFSKILCNLIFDHSICCNGLKGYCYTTTVLGHSDNLNGFSLCELRAIQSCVCVCVLGVQGVDGGCHEMICALACI